MPINIDAAQIRQQLAYIKQWEIEGSGLPVFAKRTNGTIEYCGHAKDMDGVMVALKDIGLASAKEYVNRTSLFYSSDPFYLVMYPLAVIDRCQRRG